MNDDEDTHIHEKMFKLVTRVSCDSPRANVDVFNSK